MVRPGITRGRGFTLVEILVVILMVVVLIAIVVLALLGAREAAARAVCASNMRQFGIAFTNYASQCQDLMPPCDRNIWWYLLPHIDECPRVTVKVAIPGQPAKDSVGTTNEVFRCPSDKFNDKGLAGTSYCFNYRVPYWKSGNNPSRYQPGTHYENWNWANAVENSLYSPFSTCKACDGLPSDPQTEGEAKLYRGVPADTYVMMEQWGPSDHATMYTPRYQYASAVGGAGFSALDLDLPDSDGACNGTFNGTGHQRASSQWAYLYRHSNTTWCYTSWKEDTNSKITYNGSCQDWLWSFEQLTSFECTFHRGKVNVLAMDGSVTATDVEFLAGRIPKSNPKWTATYD